MNRSELEDKLALRDLIDKISMLGDKKDFKSQIQLFSDNAIAEMIAEGKTILKLEGRKEMAQAFEKFLQEMETVYHFNSQHVVEIDGDHATGESYCFITLIGNEGGEKFKTTIGVTYDDEYIRVNDQWLVFKRVGHFKWQDKTEIK